MKLLSVFLAALFVALLGVVGSMAQTSDQVITAIESFTNASGALDTQITALNAINFPTMGLIIADGLNNITEAVNTSNTEFSVSIHKRSRTSFVVLLNVVIEKEPLAAMFHFLAPIAAALRDLELAIETFAFDLVGLIPTQEDAVLVLFDEVRGNITLAITAYSS
ncbi:hypothetical protein V8D89_008213 [Ganoderma adspersum]